MRISPSAKNEEARLLSVREYELEDSGVTPELESIVSLAKTIFETPIVLVSIVERSRQFFPAKTGLSACETTRDISFCSHAITQQGVFIVSDTHLDARFADNPLVTGKPGIRFYAGAPLISASGFALGTLCLIDIKPRNQFSVEEQRTLLELASLVSDRLELRRLERAREKSQTRFESIALTSPNAIICTDSLGLISFSNPSATRIFGHTYQEMLGQHISLIFAGESGDAEVMDERGGLPLYLSQMLNQTNELKGRHKGGSELLVEFSLTKWNDGDSINFGIVARDVTEQRTNEDRLYRVAHFDVLTDLPNRKVLRNRIDELAAKKSPMALIVLGLDNFQDLNDTLGHDLGDQLLQHVARRLLSCVRPDDTVARLGGDEFAILLSEEKGKSDAAAQVADRAIRVISNPLTIDGRTIYITASSGVASWENEGSRSDELLPNANLALFQAKAEGKNCQRVFTGALRASAQEKRVFDEEIREAYEAEQFELYYQPQVRLADGLLVGAEALLRWNHPVKGLLPPGTFLGFLEAGQIAQHVGYWILRRACSQAARWRDELIPDFRIGVNLFGAQFQAGNCPRKVLEILGKTGLSPSALELEITENIILDQPEKIVAPLRELRQAGVGIAFDDYGTGYASLSLLKQYPLSRLKIDRSFVQGMCSSSADASIIRAVLQLGKGFGLSVIAEGIETDEQWKRLQCKGCEEGQGYLFGRPMPAIEFEQKFRASVGLQGMSAQLSRQSSRSLTSDVVGV